MTFLILFMLVRKIIIVEMSPENDCSPDDIQNMTKKQPKCLDRTFVFSPIYAFLCAVHMKNYLIFYHFNNSKTLQTTAILKCFIINLFQLLWDSFFHNSVSWPELAFIFNTCTCFNCLQISPMTIWWKIKLVWNQNYTLKRGSINFCLCLLT